MVDTTELQEIFGCNVRFYRRQFEFTQSQLAERMGVCLRWVQQLETGKSKPKLATIQRVANALEIQPAVLLCPHP